jgi:Protein of unknown function (DUF3604)
MHMDEVARDIGSAVIKPNPSVVVDSLKKWEIVYTAGKKGVSSGGSVRFEIPYGFSAPQKLFISEPGYVQALSSDGSVKLELEIPPSDYDLDNLKKWRRPDNRFYYVTRHGHHLFVKVKKGNLKPGDKITLLFGHTPFPNTDVRSPKHPRRAEFSVAVAPDGTRSAKGSGYYRLPKSPQVDVLPDELEGYEVLARSTSEKPGARWSAVPIDRLGNCTDPNAYVPGSKMKLINKDRFARRTLRKKGATRIHLKDKATGNEFLSNPSIKPIDGYNLYWGDIHFHTIYSDGLGTPEEGYTYGKNISKLDFCAIADHDEHLADKEWKHITEATKEYNSSGKYVTFLGYEYSDGAMDRYGDQCIYFPGDKGPLIRSCDIYRENARDLKDIADKLKQHNAMMVVHNHHPGVLLADPDIVRLAEVYSAWGAAETSDGPITLARYGVDISKRCYKHYLDAMKIGAIAGSDGHYGHPGRDNWLKRRYAHWGGLTAVWAKKLTRKHIWEALWNRRCYGTTRPRIILWFAINGRPMGETMLLDQEVATKRELNIRVHGTAPIQSIEIIRNGVPIKKFELNGEDNVLNYIDDKKLTGKNLKTPMHYYVRVIQQDGAMVWSSPIWIEK